MTSSDDAVFAGALPGLSAGRHGHFLLESGLHGDH